MTADAPGLDRRFSLAPRILAVNVFAILALTGSIFYLDSFRERLIDQRRAEMRMQAVLIGGFMAGAPPARLPDLAARYGRIGNLRLRVYDPGGTLVADSWRATGATFELRDPAGDPFRRDVARFLDRAIEAVGSFPAIGDYAEPAVDNRAAWPEVVAASAGARAADTMRAAPDRIVIISAAAPLPAAPQPAAAAPFAAVQLTRDTRDITTLVRVERAAVFYVFLLVLAASLLLSTYLASTIVRPLRRLAEAAVRVRLGRAREVTVPRFNQRRDEIGQLARALSDMTLTLRDRIDATEAFAADVAHEIKNPLASLSSAVDTFARVDDPACRRNCSTSSAPMSGGSTGSSPTSPMPAASTPNCRAAASKPSKSAAWWPIWLPDTRPPGCRVASPSRSRRRPRRCECGATPGGWRRSRVT